MQIRKGFLLAAIAMFAAITIFVLWNRPRTFAEKWGWEPAIGGAIERYGRGSLSSFELEGIVSEKFKSLSQNESERTDFVIFVSRDWLCKDRSAAGPIASTIELFQRDKFHKKYAVALTRYAQSSDLEKRHDAGEPCMLHLANLLKSDY
jgi:hypothetical protein